MGWFGASVKRKEDPVLLTGQGRYVDDIALPGMLHAAVLRSPHAHALIRRLDKRAALALPGVRAVVTFADLPASMQRQTVPLLVPSPAIKQPRMPYCLAKDETCFVGEPVAVVLGQSRYVAEDAAALVESTYLAGTNTRRVRRALGALFGGAVGKDTVSRTWRKVKGDWDAWNARSLADEPIVRLILDGTVVRVRLDRKATSISLLVVLGVRADGQKVLLALKSMGGESAEAWRSVLDDLIRRGLRRPEFLIVDGAGGLDSAIAAVWDGVPAQRCTVHKHSNLLAHAPERLHDEVTADYNDMIYAATREEITARRKAFIRKWRLKHRAVADSLEEAGDRLFAFTRLPPGQWRSARTTNAIERLHEEFRRRIKTQTVLPSADTAAMLFWALLASGQISMRKVDGWQTLATKPIDQPIDLAA